MLACDGRPAGAFDPSRGDPPVGAGVAAAAAAELTSLGPSRLGEKN